MLGGDCVALADAPPQVDLDFLQCANCRPADRRPILDAALGVVEHFDHLADECDLIVQFSISHWSGPLTLERIPPYQCEIQDAIPVAPLPPRIVRIPVRSKICTGFPELS